MVPCPLAAVVVALPVQPEFQTAKPSKGREKSKRHIDREQQIIQIRSRHAKGGITYKELAAQYKTAESTIGNIVRGLTWTHLPVLH